MIEYEAVLRTLAGATGIATLAIAIWGMRQMDKRPAGYTSGGCARWLRWPVIIIATVLFLGALFILWTPIPLELSFSTRLAANILGSLLYFPGLGLYLWGLRTLGRMFGPSSGLGVKLYADHQLVTDGPFALVRHPMYLAVMLAGWGGLLIFKTWAMLFFAVLMFGLVFRARKEEIALSNTFGESWDAYARKVPGWLPRFKIKK